MASQLHTGSGDNVVNKYIINNSLDIDSIEAIAKELLLGIALGDYLKVQQAITYYQAISNTTSHVQNFFKLLSNYIDFTQDNKNFDIGLLKTEIQSVTLPNFKNIYQTLLIKITFKTDESRAKEICDVVKSDSDIYTLAVYHQLFATKEELISYATSSLLVVDDYSLIYLAFGFWRVGEFEEAQKVFRQISFSQSNKTIKFWIIATQFNTVENIENYSYLSLDSYRAIKKLSEEFLSLAIDEKDLPEIAINTLAAFVKVILMGNELNHLHGLAIRFRSQINSVDQTLGKILESIAHDISIEISDEVLNKLKNLQPLTTDEFTNLNACLIQGKINFETIENWLINTSGIISNDPALDEILKLYLTSFKKFNDKVEENEYRNNLKVFIENKINIFSQIHSGLIRIWCDNLFVLDDNFQIIIYQILSNLTLSGDLYVYYLQALFRIGKLEKLGQELSSLTEKDWSDDLFLLQARYYIQVGNFQKAYDAYHKIIYKTNSLGIWYEFLNALTQSEKIEEAKNEITKIPRKLFDANTPGLLEFLVRTAKTIDYNIIENLIVDLFIKNPYEYSVIVTKFHLNTLLHEKEDKINEDKKFEGIHKAVLYRANGKENLKILVDAELAKYKELVNIKSPLGTLLNSLEIGKTGLNFNEKISIIEFIPITYAVFRLAKENVAENQHNFDAPIFYEFKVTEENAQEDILEAIRLTNSESNPNDNLVAFLNSSELPLYPKGKKLESVRRFDEYLSFIYELLCNKNANSSLHGQFGSIKEFDEVFVDAFGFTYLAMTNLYKALINEDKTIFVTQETYEIVNCWLKNITREDFLTVNANDTGLVITNSKSIQYFYGDLIKATEQLLKYVKILPEKVFDLPIIIAEMRDLLDTSVFSTLKASLANNIPWLCVDRIIATLLEYSDELKGSNPIQLIDFDNFKQTFFHLDKMSFQDRKSSIGYMAFCELDIYYYQDDIIKLCSDIENFPIVIKFLENVPTNFESDKFAFTFLIHIIEQVLLSIGKLFIVNDQLTPKDYLRYSIYAHLKKNHYLPENSMLIKKLVLTCLNRANKELEGSSFEEKLSRVYIGVAALLHNSETNLFRYFDKLFFDFVKSQFISIAAINDNINKIFSDNKPLI